MQDICTRQTLPYKILAWKVLDGGTVEKGDVLTLYAWMKLLQTDGVEQHERTC